MKKVEKLLLTYLFEYGTMSMLHSFIIGTRRTMRICTAFYPRVENCVATVRRLLFRGVPPNWGALFLFSRKNYFKEKNMKIAEAKCTNCGANIKVDAEAKEGVCPYCGSVFFTQDVINNYFTTIHNTTIHNTNITAENVQVMNGNFDNLRKLAFDSWNGKDYESAYNYFSKAVEIQPNDNECLIYKALSFGWCSKFDKINLNFTNTTYQSLCLETEWSDTEKLWDYILKLNALALAVKSLSEKNYNEEYPDDILIRRINGNLRICCNTYKIILQICDKYKFNEKKAEDYLTILKNYSLCLLTLIKKKKYKPGRTGGIIDYSSIIIRDVDEIQQVFDDTEKKIKSLDPQYEGTKLQSGGCYIATCVYGSYDCPQVWTLRRYRDDTLDSTWYGRLFIKIYYKLSPTLVKLFGQKQWFQRYWRKRLDKKVSKLNKQGVVGTRYQDKY